MQAPMNVKEAGSLHIFLFYFIDMILPLPLITLCSCEMVGDARRLATFVSSLGIF